MFVVCLVDADSSCISSPTFSWWILTNCHPLPPSLPSKLSLMQVETTFCHVKHFLAVALFFGGGSVGRSCCGAQVIFLLTLWQIPSAWSRSWKSPGRQKKKYEKSSGGEKSKWKQKLRTKTVFFWDEEKYLVWKNKHLIVFWLVEVVG